MTCASGKALFVWNANNKSWICLQPVLAAVRRLRIIRFFAICAMTTSVLKIVILKNTLDHGRNFDLLLCQIDAIGNYCEYFYESDTERLIEAILCSTSLLSSSFSTPSLFAYLLGGLDSTSNCQYPYLLKASNGDSLDAFQAGIMPAPRLNSSERNQT
jgi:hypothetical protein